VSTFIDNWIFKVRPFGSDFISIVGSEIKEVYLIIYLFAYGIRQEGTACFDSFI